MIILETTRLVLKTIEKEDSSVLHNLIFSNKEMMNHIFQENEFTLEESKKFIYKNFCKNNAIIGLAPLFAKSSGQIIGLAGVLKLNESREDKHEFIVIIIDEFRKNGYATEVVQSELTFIKKRLRQNKAYAFINKECPVSKKLLEKVGMKLEKSVILKDRGNKDIYMKKI